MPRKVLFGFGAHERRGESRKQKAESGKQKAGFGERGASPRLRPPKGRKEVAGRGLRQGYARPRRGGGNRPQAPGRTSRRSEFGLQWCANGDHKRNFPGTKTQPTLSFGNKKHRKSRFLFPRSPGRPNSVEAGNQAILPGVCPRAMPECGFASVVKVANAPAAFGTSVAFGPVFQWGGNGRSVPAVFSLLSLLRMHGRRELDLSHD